MKRVKNWMLQIPSFLKIINLPYHVIVYIFNLSILRIFFCKFYIFRLTIFFFINELFFQTKIFIYNKKRYLQSN